MIILILIIVAIVWVSSENSSKTNTSSNSSQVNSSSQKSNISKPMVSNSASPVVNSKTQIQRPMVAGSIGRSSSENGKSASSSINEPKERPTSGVRPNTIIGGSQSGDKTSDYSSKDFTVCKVQQRSQAWKDLRRGRVTGSNAYFLKNNSVSRAIARSFNESTFENEAMRRGRRLEPIGVKMFADKTGLDVKRVGFVISNKHTKAGFSPDGVVFDRDKNIHAIVEHKAFNSSRHFECYRKTYTEVIYQMQFGMFVTGAKCAYLVLYNPDVNSHLIKKMLPDYDIQRLFENRFKEYESGKYGLTRESVMLERTTKDMAFAIDI